jgi:hypothetical protein
VSNPLEALFQAVTGLDPLEQRRCQALLEAAQSQGQIDAEFEPDALSSQLVALSDGIKAQLLFDPGLEAAAWSGAFYGLVGRPDLIPLLV